MKQKVLIHISMAAIVIAFSCFMVREKEEQANAAKNYVNFQQEECFSKFLSALKSMDALVYIPEKNISFARKYDLGIYDSDKSTEINTKLIKSDDTYVMVIPGEKSSECSRPILLNFEELKMTVFVKKGNVRKLEDQLKIKVEDNFTIKLGDASSELIKLDGKNGEELQIKIDNRSWTNCVPVRLK